MKRRRFLATSGLAFGAALGSAGCLGFGGGNPAPPRESEVFEQVQVQSNALQAQVDNQPMVQSRADVSQSLAGAGETLGALSPVGVAAAAKGGRGATGRGRGGATTAPRSRHGRAKWHGGDGDDYDDWREDHRDEIQEYPAAIAAVGIAYLGTTEEYRENAPPAGPVDWDVQTQNPDGTVTYDNLNEGWYRVGGRLRAANGNHDFGWEAVDAEVNEISGNYEVDTQWKVSPRL